MRTIVGDLLATASTWFATGELIDPAPAELIAAGCPGPYPDWRTSPHVLPFEPGTSQPMGLVNCTSSFHDEDRPDSHAYDFDMPRGTPILATRGGVVTRVVDDQPDLGGDPGGNLIIIDHDDGTAAAYLHLDVGGIDVVVGDQIGQGDVIGRSGATGSTTGYPHLHYIVVETPTDWPWTGVPVTFSNTEPNPRGLVGGRQYEALPFG